MILKRNYGPNNICIVKLLKTDYHCLNCGENEVWEADEDGDYYEKNDYVCVKCNHAFKLPSGCYKMRNDWSIINDTQTLD